jgi:hypothetical protein
MVNRVQLANQAYRVHKGKEASKDRRANVANVALSVHAVKQDQKDQQVQWVQRGVMVDLLI